MMHRVQAVPLNYPSPLANSGETQATATKRGDGGHLADDSRSTQHIPVNGAEWAESAPTESESFQVLGSPRAVGAVESHIARGYLMAVSKRLRFEVFKRDKFTCQYCGKRAPDVVLNADHIEPKSKGGTDDLLNLITSCEACNSGKSDKRLSDDTAVARKRDQLAALQDRQEQIAMMMEWQRSLTDLDEQIVAELADYWGSLVPGFSLNEHGKAELRKILKRHEPGEIMEAMRAGVETYVELDDEGDPTPESVEVAGRKLGAICNVRAASRDNPHLKDVFYIRGIIRNRFSYVNLPLAKQIIEEAFDLGADVDVLKDIAKTARHWSGWRTEMGDYISQLEEDA